MVAALRAWLLKPWRQPGRADFAFRLYGETESLSSSIERLF